MFSRNNLLIWKDKRSKMITEFINGLRIIKYYGWEMMVVDNIKKIRNNENKEIFV